MSVRRSLAFVAVAVTSFLGLAGVASAAPTYPPQSTGQAAVSDTQVAPGEAFTITGDGFMPNSTVQVGDEIVTSSGRGQAVPRGVKSAMIASVTADSAGMAKATVKLSTTGTHRVSLTGVDPSGATRVVSAVVVVAAPAAAGGNGNTLPKTGGDLTWLYAGAGLVLAGGVLVTATRRRRVTI